MAPGGSALPVEILVCAKAVCLAVAGLPPVQQRCGVWEETVHSGHGFCPSTTHSGRVAKEVMASSAQIKREPPEIHR